MKTNKNTKWRLRFGLLYGGLDGLKCVLTTCDRAQVFDDRDNPETKIPFWNAMLGCRFEVEICD